MREAANVGFHYNWINRIADAFDFPLPAGTQRQRLAKILNLAGKLLRGGSVEPLASQGSDRHWRPTEIHRGRELLLSAPGVTSPGLRLAIDATVAEHRDQERLPTEPLPGELTGYLSKLAQHANRITDEDISALQNAGHSDEWIYEATHVGAFGSAIVGLERLFDVLSTPHKNGTLGEEMSLE
ncbi:MAG: hypothetical protein ACI8X5_000880 [Planctomycetota bacterium]|jgi:hypothetical protein